MTHYPVRVIDGKYVVGATTDGRDFHPVPGAAFDKPRRAYQHSDVLELHVSPLRASEPGHRIEPEQPAGVGSIGAGAQPPVFDRIILPLSRASARG